jgi:hypothetical protein
MVIISTALLVVWFILKFPLHKGGYIHVLLVGAISVLVIQLLASRNARYHKTSSGRSDEV